MNAKLLETPPENIVSFEDTRKLAPLGRRRLTITVLAVPFVALLVAIVMLCWNGFDRETLVALGLFVLFYFIAGLGVTAGFHRLFTHKSYETKTWVKVLLTIAGSMSLQGMMIAWCKDHNVHHEFSDVAGKDRHTPHGHANYWVGFWYSHFGWLLLDSSEEDNQKHIKRLEGNPWIMWADRNFLYWVILGFILPGLMGGLITLSWKGAWLGFLWGGLVRLCVLQHITWCINSVCHIWGEQPFESDDESRNNVWLAFVSFLGEAWHNNHHAFEWSARHGLEWWQIDGTWCLIKFLGWSRLVWNIKVPTPAQIARKRRV